MDITELEQIVKILKQNDVTDFELVQGGTSIKLSRLKALAAGAPSQSQIIVAASGASDSAAIAGYGSVTSRLEPPQTAPAALAPIEDNSRFTTVSSPIVGTFYRKPSPDAEPFVNEGDRVKKGQTLCIVEAMKLMNEIEAPCSGRIQKVCLNDGQVVEFGETLFLIEAD